MVFKQLTNTFAPHYVREYKRMLSALRRKHGNEDAAMEAAVGGNYDGQGKLQAELVLDHAPPGPFTLIDVGCGSGRAANALKDVERLSYFGTDILADLLNYAKEKTQRPDWRFAQITDLTLPVENNWADMAMFMSVFTHLKPAEIKTYLKESARAVKPGGLIICSYLDRDEPRHKNAFRPPLLQRLARMAGRDVMLSFTTRNELSAWLDHAGFDTEKVITYKTARQHTMIGRRRPNGSAI